MRRRGHSSRRPDPEAEDEVGGQASKVLRHLRQVRRIQEVEHQAQKTKAASSEFIYHTYIYTRLVLTLKFKILNFH